MRLHKVRMDQPDIPRGRHKNKPAFETTHFCEQIVLSSYSHSQLGVPPNSFFARFGQIQYAAGNSKLETQVTVTCPSALFFKHSQPRCQDT